MTEQAVLNVDLSADCTLPDHERDALQEVGAWLVVNGEAVFDTRPWKVFGEGATNIFDHEPGHEHFNEVALDYTADESRFTTRGDRRSALCLETPGSTRSLRSPALGNPHDGRPVAPVTALADRAEPGFAQTLDALRISGLVGSGLWARCRGDRGPFRRPTVAMIPRSRRCTSPRRATPS